MTRRVRFTPLLRAGVFVAAVALPRMVDGGAVPFAPPLDIFTASSIVPALAPADVDGDGDADLVVAVALEDRVVLLRNTTGSGASWSPVTVATAIQNVRSVAAADIDRDGDVDVVSAAFGGDRIVWHENLDGAGGAWATRPISTSANGAIDLDVADVDGDGDPDVAAALFDGAAVTWYANDGAGSAWVTRTVATNLFDVSTVSHADIDRDGDLDILTVTGSGPVWYENSSGGTVFTLHTAGTVVPPSRIRSADVDRDGDPDVVLSGPGVGLAWNENAGGAGWTTHPIASGPQIVGAAAADVDGDGDTDFWTAHGAAPWPVVWYDNLAGDGSAWAPRTVATLAYSSAVALADLDGDGDLEGLTARGSFGAAVARHPNETLHRTACFAPPLAVSTFAEPAAGIAAADLDRDGDLDVVGSHAASDVVFWHESSGSAGAWTAHTLTTAVDRPGQLTAADVDGDGDEDVVADFRGPSGPTGVLWMENVAGASGFTPRTIHAASAIYGMTLTPGDIDGDGDTDVLQSGYGGSRWHRNDAGNGSIWSTVGIFADSAALADVDGDGDLDLPSASWFISELRWLENLDGGATSFLPHTIATGNPVDVLHAADLDGDGDPDFIDQGLTGIEWRRNQAAGGNWTTHAIPGAGGRPLAADLDRDGDLDLAWSEGPGSGFGWTENRDGAGLAWLSFSLPGTGSPGTIESIVAADLDRDGAIDLITNPSGPLRWHPNRGGQYSLSVSNTAPGTAQQGSLVSMLHVLARHLGRAGDGALELARFGVLLEEAAGDPLTTAEANLLVESLRVYQDANPNGFFDPADVLVGSVGALSLSGGVQEVPFADGDPSVGVSAGAVRNYFVVVELTADASTQNPNRLRATLLQLGPSASQAEHAAYDIPIVPACPADTSSGVVVATIPVELMGFTIE